MSCAAQLESGPLHEAEERSNDYGKHPPGQCGAQPHIVTEVGLPGKTKGKRNKIEVGYGN